MERKNKIQLLKPSSIQVPEPVQSVKPGNNFYTHINGNWLKNTTIPSFRSSFGVSEEIEVVIETQLQTILSKCYSFAEAGVKPSTKREKMMDVLGRFMLSALRSDKQQNSVNSLRTRLRKMICIRDTNDIIHNIGTFNKYAIPTLLSIQVFKRRDINTGYTFIIDKGKLGLPDLSYYNATGPGKTRTLLAYVNLCKEVADLLYIDDIRGAVQTEVVLATIMDKYTSDDYEDIKGSELVKVFPGIPWDILFKSYGIEHEWKTKDIRIANKKWIEYLEKIFKSWPLETWSRLFSLHMILYTLPILPSPYSTLHFDFFGKKLRGQPEKLPQSQLTLNLCRTLLKTPLSYLYIEEYIHSELKKNATNFSKIIQEHAVISLEKVEWLEQATKKIAIDKVKKMSLEISNPTTLPSIVIPDLITDNFLENMFILGEMNTRAMILHLNAKETIWNEPPYNVNAYYFSERNQFMLPAGSIQWPFYKETKTIGWNYGGLGAIIGHEITHAFDLEGKEYNAVGAKKNWWTRKDNYQYKKRTDSLVKLFDNGKILGHSVDGYLTLSENLADLGGLAIALDALLDELKGVSETDRKKQLRDFFTSYAVSWRVKERPRKVMQSLFLDVHSPAELRVNYIVSQFNEWYDIFGVTTGDKLYVPPEDRIKIF